MSDFPYLLSDEAIQGNLDHLSERLDGIESKLDRVLDALRERGILFIEDDADHEYRTDTYSRSGGRNEFVRKRYRRAKDSNDPWELVSEEDGGGG